MGLTRPLSGVAKNSHTVPRSSAVLSLLKAYKMAGCEYDTEEPAVKNPRFTLLTKEEIDKLVVAKDSQNTKVILRHIVHTTIGDL